MNLFAKIDLRRVLTQCLAVAVVLSVAAQAPSGYYDSAKGKNKGALLKALEAIVGPHTTVSYDGLYNVYRTSDVTADGYIWDMYATTKYSTGSGDRCGSYSSIGDCYNREHSFPKSWFNKASPMVSDAFHVYPTDGKVNGQRSNYPYGECANGTYLASKGTVRALGKLGMSTFAGYSGKVFEPDDQYKGDFARTYFYMAAAYNSKIGSWSSPQLAGNSYPCFSSWSVNLLLKWHRQDPVSQKEIDRNNAVEKFQHNRNPFIDHPELAEYIWGNRNTMGWVPGGVLDPILALPENNSTVSMGLTGVGVKMTRNILVKGSDLSADIALSVQGNGEFTVEPTTVKAAEAVAGKYVRVSYTPGSAGSHSAVLTLKSSEVSAVVNLEGEATEGIPACEASNVTATSFTVNWISVDTEGYYSLNVMESDCATSVAGYPVQVDPGDECYEVIGLQPSTTYYYKLTSATGRESNVVKVTTDEPERVLTFELPQGGLEFASEPGVTSEPLEVKVFTDYITEPVTVEITGNFEISGDKNNWAQQLVIDAEGESVYVRMKAVDAGEYTGTLSLHTPTFEGDDVEVHGVVADYVSFFEDFEAPTAESYSDNDYEGTACLWKRSQVGIYGRVGDKFNGSHAACTAKTGTRWLKMGEDKLRGAGVLTFYAAPYSTDEEAVVKILYSVDGGQKWTVAADNVTIQQGDLKLYSFKLNIYGSVRIGIEQVSGKRLNIDDLAITDYTGGVDNTFSDDFDAYSPAPGVMAIESTGDAKIAIYSYDAVKIYDAKPAAGRSELQMPAGVYIVVSDSKSKKVIVK